MPNINKVVYGNDTLIDLTSDTVTPSDVLNSKSFHDASGTLRTGSADLSQYYSTDDTAETTLADGDYFPFYDTSATAKKKTLWSNIKSVLKTYFDQYYNKVTVSATPTSGGTDAFSTGGAYTELNKKSDITAIGTNESGTKASKAYAAGEHFYKNGKFCTAKTAIASNATLTLNTNYTEGAIADFLVAPIFPSRSEMITPTSTYIAVSRIKDISGGFKKIGTRCYANMRFTVNWEVTGTRVFPELGLGYTLLSNLNNLLGNIAPLDGYYVFSDCYIIKKKKSNNTIEIADKVYCSMSATNNGEFLLLPMNLTIDSLSTYDWIVVLKGFYELS